MFKNELSRTKKFEHWLTVIALLDTLKPIRENDLESVSLADIRQEAKKILKAINDNLRELISDSNTYYVLFALTAHCDELAQAYGRASTSLTAPLQNELFNTNDAGNLFYKYIELFRGRNDIDDLVFQTYYFCLNDGFKGRYIVDPDMQASYKDELLSYIHVPPISVAIRTDPTAYKPIWRIPAWAYYVFVLLVFLLIRYGLDLVPLNIIHK